MTRYVIKCIEHDGSPGVESYDGIAATEDEAKENMAREHGHLTYDSLDRCEGWAGAHGRIVITQEPEPVEIQGRRYVFVITNRGKLNERLSMSDCEDELYGTPTHHVSEHLNQEVLRLIEGAYRAGHFAGERSGRYDAKAEIRRVLEIA
jgi:hypothetical protein